MADEEKNEETTEEQAPEAAEGGDDAPKEVEAPAGADAETASEEDGGGSEDASSDGEADAPAAEGDAGSGDDDMEGLDWKARRRLERSRQSGEAGPLWKAARERAEEAGLSEHLSVASEAVGFAAPNRG